MPAQTTPYRGQSTGSAQDLKEKATDQFEKIADKATDKFRDVADQAEHIRRPRGRTGPRSRRQGPGGCRQHERCRGQVGQRPADGNPCDGSRARLRPRRDLEVVGAYPQ